MTSVFDMMDANGSGRVSRDELSGFLKYIAPREATAYDIGMLSLKAMKESDSNRTGLITFSEFAAWEGKQKLLDWVDGFHDRVLAGFDGDTAEKPLTPRLAPYTFAPPFPAMEARLLADVPSLNPLLPHEAPTRGGSMGHTMSPNSHRAMPFRTMRIFYASAQFGSRGQLEVQSNDTVDSVKSMISKAEGVPAAKVRLFMNGSELRYNSLVPEMHVSLYDFGVGPGDTLQLVYDAAALDPAADRMFEVPGPDVIATTPVPEPLSVSALGGGLDELAAENERVRLQMDAMRQELALLESKEDPAAAKVKAAASARLKQYADLKLPRNLNR